MTYTDFNLTNMACSWFVIGESPENHHERAVRDLEAGLQADEPCVVGGQNPAPPQDE